MPELGYCFQRQRIAFFCSVKKKKINKIQAKVWGMHFKMLMKTIDGEKELRAKNLETEEGSCLMETWKRRGEPEKKQSQKPGRKIFRQRGNQTKCQRRLAGKEG